MRTKILAAAKTLAEFYVMDANQFHAVGHYPYGVFAKNAKRAREFFRRVAAKA